MADEFFVSAVTGSTGAGRTPRDTTHHPLRQSNLFAYQALRHRHDPEVRALIKAATGRDVRLAFVPHSGPFARGIHVTVQATLAQPTDTATVLAKLRDYYAGAPFVRGLTRAGRLYDLVRANANETEFCGACFHPGGRVLFVNQQVSPPDDLSSNVVRDLYMTLNPGDVIEGSFKIGSTAR